MSSVRVRPTTSDRHEITVATGGTVTVHRVDLSPAFTVWLEPGVAGTPTVATPRDWADGTDRLWADSTTREWAA